MDEIYIQKSRHDLDETVKRRYFENGWGMKYFRDFYIFGYTEIKFIWKSSGEPKLPDISDLNLDPPVPQK